MRASRMRVENSVTQSYGSWMDSPGQHEGAEDPHPGPIQIITLRPGIRLCSITIAPRHRRRNHLARHHGCAGGALGCVGHTPHGAGLCAVFDLFYQVRPIHRRIRRCVQASLRKSIDGCWLFQMAIVLEQKFLDGSLSSRQVGGVDVELIEDKDQLCRRIRKRLDAIEYSEVDRLLCLVVIQQSKVLFREAGDGGSGFASD